MDLSKAFDTIKHDLLIAKMEGYGFFHGAPLYIRSYMRNRSQRVTVIAYLVVGKKLQMVSYYFLLVSMYL